MDKSLRLEEVYKVFKAVKEDKAFKVAKVDKASKVARVGKAFKAAKEDKVVKVDQGYMGHQLKKSSKELLIDSNSLEW